MCINLYANQPASTPYNDSRIGWKVLIINQDGELESAMYEHIWKVGVRHRSKCRDKDTWPQNHGFHVWVNRSTAENEVGCGGHLLAKVKVEGHIYSGVNSFGRLSETWKRATLLAVYNGKGKNVTYRYKKAKTTNGNKRK